MDRPRSRSVVQRRHAPACPHRSLHSTTAERGREGALIEAGRQDAVRDTRQVFQQAMGPAFSAAIEEISGREVIAFMSQVCFAPDMAAEVFVLEPYGQDEAPEEVSSDLEPLSLNGKPDLG